MATYTPEQYGDLIERFVKGLPEVYKRASLEAAKDFEGNLKRRLFNKGKDSENKKIGNYSTTPTLIGKKSFPTATDARKVLGSKSKRSKLEWRKVKGRNLAILEGGYKEIRQISGLRTDTVDLSFKGNLQRGIKLIEKKRSVDIVIRGKKNIAKARGNEDRFNTEIFEVSKQEEARIYEIIDEEINTYINKFFD